MPDALDRLSSVNAYFTLRHGPAEGAAGRPAADLRDPAVAGELFDRAERILGTTERRVAVSWVFFEYIARLWAVSLGTAMLTGRSVDLDPERLRISRDGNSTVLHTAEPVAGGSPIEEVAERHVEPLVAAWRAHVAPGLLWGNAAASVTSAGSQLGADADAVVRQTLHHPRLRSALDVDALERRERGETIPTIRRRSCCLYYRTSIGGYCGDCSMTR
ncbi:MAG: (2Fe-2S)-binding protein [Gordonia sp. (in: high G+C Gram-positive bacteria)]|uniref:(2Fe-2S)-binding protein n=1 Tax=Gordonia sp. (in: high G+C Gram-positive bacteria) TaxID=84139 RepID=UPI0039E5238C